MNFFQNANNGKELIATAIGEPLVSTDTFSAMSNRIDGLTSSFKTALMNNGISIEAGDKFKSLIEKLALLADSEGSGIQFASGVTIPSDESDLKTFTYMDSSGSSNIRYTGLELEFTPAIIYIKTVWYTSMLGSKLYYTSLTMYENLNDSEQILFVEADSSSSNDSEAEFKIFQSQKDSSIYYLPVTTGRAIISNGFTVGTFGLVSCDWHAIGVGEEDTTLEDSLRSILTSKGVSVTEEDDLNSLIIKVDEIYRNPLPRWYKPTWFSSTVTSMKSMEYFMNAAGTANKKMYVYCKRCI